MLRFYSELATLQGNLLGQSHEVVRTAADSLCSFSSALDAATVATRLLPQLLEWLAEQQRDALAIPAVQYTTDDWVRAIETCWQHGGADGTLPAFESFAVEATLQPLAHAVAIAHAARATSESQSTPRVDSDQATCPVCGGLPTVATLNERGHGAGRALVCGLCATEWPCHRFWCPSCGETAAVALSVYRADDLPAVRIDACNGCRRYLKTLDRSVDGTLEPYVDDVASLTLDLWAREQGYQRSRPSLLQL